MVRPARDRRRRRHVRRVGVGRARATAQSRDHQCRRGAHHRVPVRSGPRDADVRDGRHGARALRPACSFETRKPWKCSSRCRRSSSTRPARSPKGALRWRRSSPMAASMPRRCCAWRPVWSTSANIRWQLPSWRVPGTAASSLAGVRDFQSVTGRGVQGMVDGRPVAIGNLRSLRGDGHRRRGTLRDRASALRREGQTVVFVAIDGRAAGLLGVVDPDKAVGRRTDPGAPPRRIERRHAYR